MALLQTLLAFIVALGVLIAFHEFGHYWVARKCGVKVLRFSLGFGSPIWSRRYGADQTEWAIGAFPLGGYVKMLGDGSDEDIPPADAHRAFNRQPVHKRMAIVVAGPVANFLLAIVVYWGLFMYGIPGMKPIIGEVKPNTVAAVAGLRAGDTITAIDGEQINTSNDLRMVLIQRALDHATPQLTVLRADGSHARYRLDLSQFDRDSLEQDLLATIGTEPYRPQARAVIGSVAPDGAAAKAGIQPGDEVRQINGVALKSWDDMAQRIAAAPNQSLRLTLSRQGRELQVDVVPRPAADNPAAGRIGVGVNLEPKEMERLYTVVSFGPIDAFVAALEKTWDLSLFSLRIMGKMVVGEVSTKNLSGPVTIADYAGQSAKAGLMPFLLFLALVSVSLGVLNLLPIPLLDGGHLLYYMAEIIKGKPLSERALEIGQSIGFALLVSLMILAFYNDLNRHLAG